MANASFSIIPARVLGDKRLCRTDIVTLNALGLFSDKEGWCFPSHATIASIIHVHVDSVRKSTRHLAACGYLEIKSRSRKDGGQTSNEYRIIFDDLNAALPDGFAHPPGRIDPTPYDAQTHPPGTERPTPYNIDTLTTHLTSHRTLSLNNKKQCRYLQGFEQFWMTWPQKRRCEKPIAYIAWQEACCNINSNALLEAAKRYLLSKEAKDGFAPYPAKWLKRERWLEYPDENPEVEIMPSINDLGDDTPENRGLLIILEKLKALHGEAVFRSWFSQIQIAHKNCTLLRLSAPTRFIASWINSHYHDDIQNCATQLWPEITSLAIEVR